MNTIVLGKNKVITKTTIAVLSVAAAIVLPQIFHAIGIISGVGGASTGSAFLPMHIPVLIAGLIGGPVVGVIVGLVSPLLSFAISGMPAVALLPFMMIELAGYGLVSGMIAQIKTSIIAKVIIAQIGGRLLRLLAVLTAVYGFGVAGMQASSVWQATTAGLWGILIQLILIPLLIPGIKGAFSKNE